MMGVVFVCLFVLFFLTNLGRNYVVEMRIRIQDESTEFYYKCTLLNITSKYVMLTCTIYKKKELDNIRISFYKIFYFPQNIKRKHLAINKWNIRIIYNIYLHFFTCRCKDKNVLFLHITTFFSKLILTKYILQKHFVQKLLDVL